jgi:adenylate cyclase
VVNAVQCAVEIQTTLKAENANLPSERRMEFRIGVNLGDVMVDGAQIYGDGVNVAARLESLADPGGICISHTVHDQIKNKLALNYEDLGPQTVKNIAEPVRVFRIMSEGEAATRRATKATQRFPRKHWRGGLFSLAGLALIAAVIVFVQHLSLRPPATTASISPTQSPALSLPNIPSIAVLPFTNMSGDREQEYFSDGFTDDLISALSRLPDLFVIARTSTFTYKGKAAKVQDVSRELGVKYILEGSVRKEADQVRITVQLADATTGADLWAERYDRPMGNIFALQDEIVRRIATTLNLQLGLWEKQRIRVIRTTDNLEAYDYFLRGLETDPWNLGTKEQNLEASEMYEKAIKLDSKYGAAYAFLGWSYFWAWYWQWTPDPGTLDRALQLEQQAVALDDSLPWSHMALGAIYLWKRQFDHATAEGERAIALNPNYATAYLWMGVILNYTGKPAEAIGLAEKAMRLDPWNRDLYIVIVGSAYTMMGRYAEAIPPLKRHLDRHNNLGAHVYLAMDYIELGREEEARAEAAEILRINPNFSLELFRQRVPAKDQKWLKLRLADLRNAGLK